VTKAWREKHTTPILHAAALKSWGEIEWAWPRDGRRETLEGAGIPLMRQYATQGLSMLSSQAAYDDGTPGGNVSVEAGLMDMLDRMQTGRLKVYSNLNDWFEEFRLYHRKDGKVFKEHDDLMAATRYGIMSLRHARKLGARRDFNRPLKMFSIGAINADLHMVDRASILLASSGNLLAHKLEVTERRAGLGVDLAIQNREHRHAGLARVFLAPLLHDRIRLILQARELRNHLIDMREARLKLG
jgi:hypothetical protein